MPKSPQERRAPQQKRSRATVEAILAATADVLTNTDVDQASTRQIADRAGIGVGSLYDYYADKNALVRALVARFADQISTEIHAIFDARADEPLEVMVPRLIHGVIEVYDRNTALHARLLRLIPSMPGENPLDVIEGPICDRFAALVIACIATPTINVDKAALVLVHASRRLLDAACADDRLPIDLKEIETELTALALGYLNVGSKHPSSLSLRPQDA